MTTEEQKTERLLKVFNIGMHGMIKGLWDIFGETSFATTSLIGDRILTKLEQEGGLQLKGETPEQILQELVHVLVNDVGTMSGGTVAIDGDKVSIACQECFLREATAWLEAEGVQPFACLPMNVGAAAMRKRLGTKHRLLGRSWNPETETCTISFQLIE